MIKSRSSDLHQSIRIAPRERVKREHREISSVRLLIDVLDSQMVL